jgi:uncharacterized protein
MMRPVRTLIGSLLLVLIASWAGAVRLGTAQEAGKASQRSETGIAMKKPVFGGACKICPWGSMAEVVKAAMQPYGYDVQICYNCAGGPQAARFVAGALMPPSITQSLSQYPELHLAIQMPPPPNGPVDFGSTYANYAWWAYQGNHDYTGEGPRQNLRLLANIQDPTYLIAAVRAGSAITDLRQITEKHLKVRVVATGSGASVISAVLDYYGLTKTTLESAGGQLSTGMGVDERKNFDVIIGFGSLDDTPEYNIWYETSQKFDLTYLQLPEDLLDKLSKGFDMQRRDIPDGLLRGIDHPIPTVARTGNVIYGRADMPDDFAYTVAKAMDEQQDLLQWTNGSLNFSYNIHNVWKAFGLPLHPGAAKYYRERGYMN